MASQLPAPRVVITSHTKEGTSVFTADKEVTPFAPFGPNGNSFARFHSRLSVPVNNLTSPPEIKAIPKCSPNGVLFCTTDFPPGSSSPMHRTLTLDYGIVISGEIVLRLDSGEEKTVGAGEFIVNRGSNHEWHNRRTDICRIASIMVGAEKIMLGDGEVLEETVFGKKP